MNGVLSAIVLAFSSIGRAKIRALLTVLGVLIGVAAVVIVTALGTGVEDRIATQIKSLGSNAIFVWGRSNQLSGARSRTGGRLSEGDGRAVLREASSIASLVPFLSSMAQVVVAEKNVATTVVGSSRAYLEVRGYAIVSGANFTDGDERLKAKVCVIGNTVKENLFGRQDAVGQVLRIGRHPFRVLGVLAAKGQSPSGEDQDDKIIMPAGTFRARVLPTWPGRVHMLIAQATDPHTVARGQSQIEAILRQRHHIEAEREADFGISSQAEFLKAQEEIFGTLKMLLVGIALVSLGVGGIGVMNIMLVSVTERTREIGIRMAIGAREGDVRFQFLVEAVTLSMLGGICGIALGVGVVYGLSRALSWSMLLPPSAIVMAVATSFTVGVVFGFLPARNASRLDPIDALRHE